jgi:CheY-like chemotaxis protein
VRWFGTNTDVTGQREAEESLREADRRKDEFTAVLAHELRNPLAPVRNAVEILRRIGPDEPRLQRAQAIIARQVSHMARLIDDLLDVSRIARGKLALQVEPCDLAAIVRDTTEDYRPTVEGEGLQLVLRIHAQPVQVEGDPVRLAQMLGNVLTNAVRFNQPQGRIEVQLDRTDQDALITVTDTGVGIDAQLLERLFDPFAQAVQDLARSKGGLGLGLALTRGLAELHGGSVVAHSEGPGRGARFILTLPLLDTAHAPPPAPNADATEGADGLHILLVEDNLDTATTLGELLQMIGHQVSVTHDGPSGLETARRLRPDVVISDLGLPGELDGFAVGRALRDDPALAGTRLIALSGYADEAARRRCIEAGFHDHIAKPPDLAELEATLVRISRQRGPAEEPASPALRSE